MKPQYLVIIFFIINIINSFSQSSNSLDNQYTPPSSSIMNSSQSSSGGSYSIMECNKNAVRINISNMLRSNYLFTYERLLAEKLALTGGIGFSADFDKIFLFFLEDDVILDNNYGEIDYYHLMDASIFKNGYLGQFTLRKYSDQEYDFLRFYEIGFGTNIKNITFPDFGYSNHIIAKSDRIIVNSFFCNYGNQWNRGGGGVKFSHDLSVGLGIKSINTKVYKENIIYGQNSSQITVYSTDGSRQTKFFPYLSLTYCLGLGWK